MCSRLTLEYILQNISYIVVTDMLTCSESTSKAHFAHFLSDKFKSLPFPGEMSTEWPALFNMASTLNQDVCHTT